MKRNITIYSTSGGTTVLNDSEIKTFGELCDATCDKYNYTKLTATENINKTTIQTRDTLLPEEDFVLFLRPSKIKAGIK